MSSAKKRSRKRSSSQAKRSFARGGRGWCKSGKKKYFAEQDAIEARGKEQERLGSHGSSLKLRYYSCDMCHGFHLTTQPERQDGAVV